MLHSHHRQFLRLRQITLKPLVQRFRQLPDGERCTCLGAERTMSTVRHPRGKKKTKNQSQQKMAGDGGNMTLDSFWRKRSALSVAVTTSFTFTGTKKHEFQRSGRHTFLLRVSSSSSSSSSKSRLGCLQMLRHHKAVTLLPLKAVTRLKF